MEPIIRSVSIEELTGCPGKRLDAEHWIPIHRTWECRLGSIREKGELISAWINGEVSTEEFMKAMPYVTEKPMRTIHD